MLRNIIIYVVAVVVALALISCLVAIRFVYWDNLHPKLQKLFTAVQRKLMFSSVIRSVLTGYLSASISVCYSLQQGTSNGGLNFCISIATVVALVAFPIFSQLLLKKKGEALTDKETREKYGTLYSGVEAYKKPDALAFTTLFCVRRLVIAASIVFLSTFLVGQVFVTVMSSLAITCWFAAVKPMEDAPTNFIYVFNECMLLLF